MSYHRPLKIPVNPLVMRALIESGRLKWPQRHDGFAVGMALDKLLQDILAGREPCMPADRARKIFSKVFAANRSTVTKFPDRPPP